MPSDGDSRAGYAALGVAADKSNDRRYRSGYGYRQSQPYYSDSRYRSYDQGRYYGGERRRSSSHYGYDNYGYGYRR